MAKDRVTAATFREPLLRALGSLSNLQPGVEVHFKDTYAHVLADVGIEEGAYGVDSMGRPTTHVWINQAFNKKLSREGLAEKGSKKGMWTLTSEGVKAASLLVGVPLWDGSSKAETREDLVEFLDTTVTPTTPPSSMGGGEGVSWSPGPMENSYNPDNYLRSLAVAQTKCFSEYSSRSDLCKSCPLMGACKASSLGRLASIAARLQIRDEQEALRRLRGDLAPVELGTDDLDIDAILEAIEGTEGTEDTGTMNPDDYATIDPVPADTKCSGCAETLVAGSVGYYKRGDGLFHAGCRK